jgi:polysaccharide biosynthesis transport protein
MQTEPALSPLRIKESARAEAMPELPAGYYRSQGRNALGLKDLLKIARRRGLLIAGVTGLAFAACAFWTLRQTPLYKTEFSLLVKPIEQQRNSDLPVDPAAPESGYSLGNDYASNHSTLIEVLGSPRVLESAVAALKPTYPDISIDELANGISIAQLEETDILAISYTDSDRQRAQFIARTLTQVYLRYGDSLRKSSLDQGIQFVDKQLPTLQARVSQLQKQLELFRQKYTIVDPEARGTSLAEFLKSIEEKQQETNTSLTEAKQTYASLKQQLGNASTSEAIAASSLSKSPRYQALLNRLQDAEAKIAEAAVTYQPDSPQMQVLQETRAGILPLLDQEAKRVLGNRPRPRNQGNLAGVSQELNDQLVQTANNIQMLEARSRALQSAQARLTEDFKLYPALSRQYTDLQRQLKIASDSLERFLTTRETLQIQAAQKSKTWQLMSMPELPLLPIFPNIPRNLALGFLGSLLLGISAAILAEKLNSVVHSTEDLKQDIMSPVLAVIPYYKEAKTSPQELVANSPAVTEAALLEAEGAQPTTAIAVQRPVPSPKASRFIEAFRSLSSSIKLLSAGDPIRSLTISSAMPADGKSTVAYNLAVAAAAMGQRVLLVDADLRRPRVHVNSNLPNMRGLTSIITADLEAQQVIQLSPLEPNLSILTAGPIPPDPTRLLSSPKMQQLMQEFESKFELVIYDTPPLVGFADSLLLSSKTDGCVMVIGLEHTDRPAMLEALEQLRIAGTQLLGIAANCIKPNVVDQKVYDRYYYRYYSHHRPGEEQDVQAPV